VTRQALFSRPCFKAVCAATEYAREEAERRADSTAAELARAREALADAELCTREAEAAVEALKADMEMAAEEAELNAAGSSSARDTERLKQAHLVRLHFLLLLRGTRPSTLRNWGGQCVYTGFWDTVRHPADRFQCLLELLNPQL